MLLEDRWNFDISRSDVFTSFYHLKHGNYGFAYKQEGDEGYLYLFKLYNGKKSVQLTEVNFSIKDAEISIINDEKSNFKKLLKFRKIMQEAEGLTDKSRKDLSSMLGGLSLISKKIR
jgi:hypothetical protein